MEVKDKLRNFPSRRKLPNVEGTREPKEVGTLVGERRVKRKLQNYTEIEVVNPRV